MFFFWQYYKKNKIKKGVTLTLKPKSNSKATAQKRISFCLQHILLKKISASMTLEAALVLPLFLFVILNLISVIEIYRVQSNMSVALHSTAKQMAVYGYEFEEIGVANNFTCLYAANNVKKLLGNDYFEKSPVKNGFGGISWSRSQIMEKDDCIDLVAEYRIKPFVSVMGFSEFDMYNRIRTRAWTGYDNSKELSQNKNQEELVYITPDGVVYHKSRGCTYLKLTISAIDMDLLKNKRSEDGSIYYACEDCGNKADGTVYITNYGNRFHSTLRCSKLKRTIIIIPISKTGQRWACSKCG